MLGGDLGAYLYRRAYILAASNPYSLSDAHDDLTHLTNLSVNKVGGTRPADMTLGVLILSVCVVPLACPWGAAAAGAGGAQVVDWYPGEIPVTLPEAYPAAYEKMKATWADTVRAAAPFLAVQVGGRQAGRATSGLLCGALGTGCCCCCPP